MKKFLKIINTFTLVAIASVFVMFCALVSGNVNSNLVSAYASIEQTKIVQARLIELGYYSGNIDGVYDNEIIDAVITFQKDSGLPKTGQIDYVTAEALGVSTVSQVNSDVYLLAKLVHSEARGEEYIGQVAVASVVLNRVKDPNFPNSVSEVIYQPYAFTAVDDGQFNLEPNEESYQAAQDAINGWDPSYGSLFYYNPAIATSEWIFTRQVVVTIGKHVFAI